MNIDQVLEDEFRRLRHDEDVAAVRAGLDWEGVRHRAHKGRASRPGHPSRSVRAFGRGIRLAVAIPLLACLVATAFAAGYTLDHLSSRPVPPWFARYLHRTFGNGSHIDVAKARELVRITTPDGSVMLWSAPGTSTPPPSAPTGNTVAGIYTGLLAGFGGPGIPHHHHYAQLGVALATTGGEMLDDRPGQRLWVQYGQLAPGVAQLVILFADHTRRKAAVANGWYLYDLPNIRLIPTRAPVALLEKDAAGHLVARIPQDPRMFLPQ